LKLVLTITKNPGAYALLLGSGVSRAAGIPTGWEIVLDLIRKIARLQGENPEPDPEKWYVQKFGEDPDYSVLLEKLAGTQAERNALLRSYFEPNQEESEQGLKMPTAAHKAIASLVKYGYVRMILTTNFDRLLELALQEEGIVPDVISNDDTLQGVMPYVHSKCTVVKLHGDYRDIRIKNTFKELSQYSKALNAYLDRVFDEFGLIICGWSGAWDIALRNALFRAPNRRFTTYWAARGEPNEEARSLIAHRKAEVIRIKSADEFFTGFLEKVEALRELERPHPLSTRMAVATVKKYLTEEKYRIRLHDLVIGEVGDVYKELSSPRFDISVPPGTSFNKDFFQKRMHQLEALVEKLIGMFCALIYFDKNEENAPLLTKCIERMIHPPLLQGHKGWREGIGALINLHWYPALLLSYAGGICALAAGHYHMLFALLGKPKYRDYYYNNRKLPAVEVLNLYHVFRSGLNKWVPRPNAETEYTPSSNYLLDVLREPLRPYLQEDGEYEITFNIYEYLLGLIYEDFINVGRERNWAPAGRFWWRYRDDWNKSPIMDFINEGLAQGEKWELLKAGFFEGNVERFQAAREKYHEFLKALPWW